ncbi:MAG: TIGR00153 family protein [Parachlamydiales bacterium]|nr:TIGR00153 family protein [Parachlamydiales bacterium]
MRTLVKLFGKSPFTPLQNHMERVTQCVAKINEIFEAVLENDQARIEKLSEEISDLEHQADLTKNDIRNNLGKGFFFLIDRSDVLDILQIQDSIADAAEDIGVLLTLRPATLPQSFHQDFKFFLEKNIECFYRARHIISELHELMESSFGGAEAEKVRQMVREVAFLEHEADVLQVPLLKKLFQSENELSHTLFQLWLKVFSAISALSNLSEQLANRIRMTLDVN